MTTDCLELRKSGEQLIRELQADHAYLVKVTRALIDKVIIHQSDIARIKTRLRKLIKKK